MNRQKALASIHIMKKTLVWSDDEYIDIINTWVGKQSCKDMTLSELKIVADNMRKCLEKNNPSPNAITDKQWRAIRYYQRALKMDEQHLDNFIKKITKIESRYWLRTTHARAIITGLKKTLEYKRCTPKKHD